MRSRLSGTRKSTRWVWCAAGWHSSHVCLGSGIAVGRVSAGVVLAKRVDEWRQAVRNAGAEEGNDRRRERSAARRAHHYAARAAYVQGRRKQVRDRGSLRIQAR